MSEHEDVVKILADPKWDRGERIYEWPEDEAEAYRELGWAEGMAAAKKIRIDKFAEELLSSGWLAAHDAEVAATALDEMADAARIMYARAPFSVPSWPMKWLNRQAAEYRKTEPEGK